MTLTESMTTHLFSRQTLRHLLIPLIIEQVLTALMGTADIIMVSNVGAEAISGVSLVDTLNTLMLFLFSALATGGTIVCAQYLGSGDGAGANNAARQVLLSTLSLALGITVICLAARRGLLRLIFGSVDDGVMAAALIYFFITALSYPFIALYNAGAALYRASGNARLPMSVSIGSNCLNIAGNALLIFGLHMGVAGAALSTLASRIVSAAVLLVCLRRPGQIIEVGPYRRIRPDWRVIRLVLRVGVPTGLENGLFQFGKLAIQSTVSTLGTTAIAAQAMTIVLEGLTSNPSMAIGLGLVTVAGQCMGAGRADETRYYTKRLMGLSELVLIGTGLLVWGLTWPVTALGGMTPESAALTRRMMTVITIVKPFIWVPAFTLPNCMRASGDVKYPMLVSIGSMWLFRVALCVLLCTKLGFGPMGVWIGMFVDWTCRSILFIFRYRSGKWTTFSVLE